MEREGISWGGDIHSPIGVDLCHHRGLSNIHHSQRQVNTRSVFRHLSRWVAAFLQRVIFILLDLFVFAAWF